MPSENTGRVLRRIDAAFADSVARLQELLRFPSVGVDPQHAGDTLACARWLADQLAGIGMDASRPADRRHAHGRGARPHGTRRVRRICSITATTTSSPRTRSSCGAARLSSPVLVEGPHGERVVARGAVDDKGQLMCIVEALRAWKAVHGRLAGARHPVPRGRGGVRQHAPGCCSSMPTATSLRPTSA